jgi:pimeloyl-ACP methyl ester carboxylesterase
MENRKKILVPIFSDPMFLDAMVRLTVSAETHNTVDNLNQITADTLIISSEQDYLTPVYEQQFLHSKIDNSKLVIIPNCGHASMYEVPELFTSLVLGFINRSKIPKII